jgi:hypothetical protein
VGGSTTWDKGDKNFREQRQGRSESEILGSIGKTEKGDIIATIDSILHQERKDVLGDIVGSIGGGRTGKNADPNDDRAETPLLLLSWRSVSEEASRVDGRPVDLAGLDQVTNLGTDSAPDTI